MEITRWIVKYLRNVMNSIFKLAEKPSGKIHDNESEKQSVRSLFW